MFLYTYNPNNGKHLKLTIPGEWDMDDVRFFIHGKPHLKLSDATTQKPESSKTTKTPEVSKTPNITSGCSKHPGYTGRRLGKNAKNCSVCRAFYDKLHSSV